MFEYSIFEILKQAGCCKIENIKFADVGIHGEDICCFGEE
jgi:hypothetical protein